MNSKQEELIVVIHFLSSIGIDVREKKLPDTTFLPGLMLGPEIIYIDKEKLLYPGDVLHEAGHIAVTSPLERKLIGTNKMTQEWPTQGDEIAAILWSYAALTHLNLTPQFVFHDKGYKENSKWFINNFTTGNYIGLPLLQYYKMASSQEQVNNNPETAFPYMQNWIRTV